MAEPPQPDQRIVHDAYGDPVAVLRHEKVQAQPDMPPGHMLVRVVRSIIHPGDLQLIEARYSDPTTPLPEPRQPGSEAAGIIEDASPGAFDGTGLSVGSRVAFFAPGAWRSRAVVPPDLLVALPDEMSDIVATQLLVNVITARMVLRQVAGTPQRIVQSGAASAVGKIITALALRDGIAPVRLVRSEASAARLQATQPGGDILSTTEDGWKGHVRDLCNGHIPVVLDAVGGPLLADLTDLVDLTGHIVTYGLLSNAPTDLRLVVPKALTISGVTLGTWRSHTSDADRAADVQTAITLGLSDPGLFSGSRNFAPSELSSAIHTATAPGKTGNVILTF